MAQKPRKLLDQVRDALRLKHYAYRTEQSYVDWIRRFISRFKTEGHSLFLDAQSLTELGEVVDQRMQYHNVERLHSSIGYRSPLDFIQHVTVMSTREVHT